MGRKIQAVIVQPVHDGYGQVVFQPGAHLDQDDPRLAGLPAVAFRYEVVEMPDPEPAVAVEETGTVADSLSVQRGEPGIVELRAQAERLGVKVDGRWSAQRLADEIVKAAEGDAK